MSSNNGNMFHLSMHIDLDNMDNFTLMEMMVSLSREIGRRRLTDYALMERLATVTPIGDLGFIIRAWLKVAMDNKVSIPGYTPPGELVPTKKAVAPVTPLNDIERAIVETGGGLIPAIKMYRQRCGVSLKEAKDACDVWREYAKAKRVELIEDALKQHLFPG